MWHFLQQLLNQTRKILVAMQLLLRQVPAFNSNQIYFTQHAVESHTFDGAVRHPAFSICIAKQEILAVHGKRMNPRKRRILPVLAQTNHYRDYQQGDANSCRLCETLSSLAGLNNHYHEDHSYDESHPFTP